MANQKEGAWWQAKANNEVLLGPKFPTWGCSRCGFGGNWASRLVCKRCGNECSQTHRYKAIQASKEAWQAKNSWQQKKRNTWKGGWNNWKAHGQGGNNIGQDDLAELEMLRAKVAKQEDDDMETSEGDGGKKRKLNINHWHSQKVQMEKEFGGDHPITTLLGCELDKARTERDEAKSVDQLIREAEYKKKEE